MITYHPPKSQVWGHQVGRLPAKVIVERCLTFLDSHCTILHSQPSELMLAWTDRQDLKLIDNVVNEIDQTLGHPNAVHERRAEGRLIRQRRWPFSAEHLPVVAAWFDQLAEAIKTKHVVAHSSTLWAFAWRDEPVPLDSERSAGGRFGIHLSRPHRITTFFSFRDLDAYARIKATLSQLQLIELSDKHLRPKLAATAGNRRPK